MKAKANYPNYSTIRPHELGHVGMGEGFIDHFPEAIKLTPSTTGESVYNTLIWPISEALEMPTYRVKNHNGVVYGLYCDSAPDEQTFVEDAMAIYNVDRGNIPSHLWAAYHEYDRLYIGGTYRFEKRMTEHLSMRGEYEGAKFTNLFPPSEMGFVVFNFSNMDIYQLEEQIANKMKESDSRETEFIYQA